MNREILEKAKDIESNIKKRKRMIEILKTKNPEIHGDVMGYVKWEKLSEKHVQVLKEVLKQEIEELEKELEEL